MKLDKPRSKNKRFHGLEAFETKFT